jgi:hypothetical protein
MLVPRAGTGWILWELRLTLPTADIFGKPVRYATPLVMARY